ncbi:MAG: hypothetical protein HXY24_10375 [Rubrivivax sp.]|nr:hypothetical protein [Rubrivivax sp.]
MAVTVSIQESDKALHFYVPSLSVNEDAGAVEIKVARGDDGGNRVSVDYATTDLTAQAGRDYTATAGTVTFEPGEVLKSVSVPILNDALREASKSFRLTLSNPTGDGALGSPSMITVAIQDTDQTFQFNSKTYSAREEVAYVQVGIIQGENDASATVDCTTSDGTAIAGVDYVPQTGTIQFASGERVRQVRIPLLNQGLKDASRAFGVTLRDPTAGAALGSLRTATVQLSDNDPGVGFTANYFLASASETVTKVCVRRGSDDPASWFTVDYQTVDVTALAGVDYQAVSSTLEFKPGETLQTITIPLLRNAAAKGRRSFKVTLSNLTEGIPSGTASTTIYLEPVPISRIFENCVGAGD